MSEGKITLKENQEDMPKDFKPTEDTNLDNLPYRLSMFVTLLKKEREIKAVNFVELLNRNGVKICTDIDNDGTRELRIMKEDLINAGYPIGSNNSRGYFFICNGKDEEDAYREYVGKAKTMLVRANKIKTNTRTYYQLAPDSTTGTLFQIREV